MSRKNRLTWLACLIVAVASSSALSQTASSWAWGPVVGAVGETVAVVSWESTRTVSIDMHYGPADIYDESGVWEDTLTFDRQEGPAEIWLQDLLPGTTYRFRLIAYEGDAVFPSKIGSFQTPSPELRSLTILSYGHTLSYPDRHKLVADAMANANEDAALAIHVGEIVETFTEERLDNFFWSIADLGRTTPYVAAVAGSGTAEGAYFRTFALPQGGGLSGEQWWSLETGPVCLIALDSTLDTTANTAAVEQAAWLRQTLAATTAPIRIVFCSDPLYSKQYADGSNGGLVDLWKDALVEGDVDVLVASYPGGYEHGYVSGIHYVNSGGGGGPSVEARAGRVPGLVFTRTGMLHYLRFTVADLDMRVEAVPVASVVNDEVFLTPSSGAIDSFVIHGD